ncbi:hypothetical protein ABIB62_002405 [Mucilaginibacter sp. UYP25]
MLLVSQKNDSYQFFVFRMNAKSYRTGIHASRRGLRETEQLPIIQLSLSVMAIRY